jgi:hypothetical protein
MISHRFHLKIVTTFLAVTTICAYAVPARAGFEWIAPPESAPVPANQAPSGMMALPSSPGMQKPEIISPVVITGSDTTPTPSAPAPIPAPAPAQSAVSPSAPPVALAMPGKTESSPPPAPSQVPEMPLTVDASTPPSAANAPAPVPAMPMLQPPASAPANEGVVQGFANHVPLTVALRQILPSGYGFSIDPDVDMGGLVSFQGGKPWRETLADALAPLGLVMREQGQLVSISHANSAAPASAPLTTSAAPAPTPTAEQPSSEQAANVAGPQGPGAPPRNLELPPGAVPAEGVASSNVASSSEGMPSGSVIEAWHADRGDSLRKVLEDWCRRANVELEWLAEYDYPLQASINYSGTYEDAVRNILIGFQDAHPQPVAQLHANSAVGQMILVVRTRGNNYTD